MGRGQWLRRGEDTDDESKQSCGRQLGQIAWSMNTRSQLPTACNRRGSFSHSGESQGVMTPMCP